MRKKVSKETTLSAPVGGWNARDALAAMKPEDAVILDNWFPETDGVSQRKGSIDHVTGLGSNVESLMVYEDFTSVEIYAAAGDSIYDVTNATATASAVVTSQSNARWQHVNFKTSGGQYLYAVNGQDAARAYDGTTWNVVNSGAAVSINGSDSANFIGIFVHVERVMFVEKDSLSFWYLPVQSVGGTVSEFDLGDVFDDGGYLVAGGSWTHDAGDGMDDYAAFITSKGQVAVYQGTSPDSASTWVKVGTFRIAPPIGRRCMFKYRGDLIIITRDGFVPMSKILTADRAETAAISYKIRGAVQDAVLSYGSNYGWEGLFYSEAPFLLFNIPIGESSGQHQYVVNTTTGAWCRFTGWDAICWCVANDVLYYGTNGKVVKAWFGNIDNSSNIVSDCLQAFNYFGTRGRVKRFTLGRPLILAEGVPGITMSMNVDYETQDPTSDLTFTGTTAGVWDTFVWDVDAWGGDKFLTKKWQTLGGVGTCGGLRMRAESSGINVTWTATDIAYEVGGVL